MATLGAAGEEQTADLCHVLSHVGNPTYPFIAIVGGPSMARRATRSVRHGAPAFSREVRHVRGLPGGAPGPFRAWYRPRRREATVGEHMPARGGKMSSGHVEVVTRFRGRDYEEWRAMVEAHEPARVRHGAVGHWIGRSIGDPQKYIG